MPVLGGWSATSSANMSSNSRNVKLPFLTTRCPYWGERSASRSATSPATMSSNSRNVKLPFLTMRCHYCGERSASRSATSPATMSSNSRNVKLPFLTMRCQYWGVDLPLHLPIWALTVEMWNCHSWPQDAPTGGRDLPVDLPLHLPLWALTVEMWNCHSWLLDASIRGVCRSAITFGTSSANMSLNSRDVKLPFLTTRCQYWGVDLPLHLPLWALTVEMWNCHSWLLDATTRGVDLPALGGVRSATWSA